MTRTTMHPILDWIASSASMHKSSASMYLALNWIASLQKAHECTAKYNNIYLCIQSWTQPFLCSGRHHASNPALNRLNSKRQAGMRWKVRLCIQSWTESRQVHLCTQPCFTSMLKIPLRSRARNAPMHPVLDVHRSFDCIPSTLSPPIQTHK